MFNLLLSNYAIDTVEPYAKWATVGIAAAIVLAGLVIFLIKKAAFILPHQLSLLISLTLAFTSDMLWTDRIK